MPGQTRVERPAIETQVLLEAQSNIYLSDIHKVFYRRVWVSFHRKLGLA
jgi:hypothetical protein